MVTSPYLRFISITAGIAVLLITSSEATDGYAHNSASIAARKAQIQLRFNFFTKVIANRENNPHYCFCNTRTFDG